MKNLKKKQTPLKFKPILISMLFILISTSISPVLATDNNSGLADSPWPTIGHDNHNTGQSQYLGAQNNTTKWIHNLTEGESNEITGGAVIGKEGNIYFGTEYYDGTRTSSRLYSLYPNGTERWNYTIEDGTNSWGILPVIGADGTIYFTNQYDTDFEYKESLYAFDPEGNLKWRYNFTDGYDAVLTPPIIGSDGTLYLGGAFENTTRTFVRFFGFNPDGTLKWNTTITDGDFNQIWTLPAIGQDGSIYFGTYFDNDTGFYGNLYAVNPDGTIKWNFIPENIELDISSVAPSVGADGTIYIGTSNYNDTRSWISLFAINPNGSLKWNQTFFDGDNNWIMGSTSVSSSGILYFLSNFVNDTGWFGNLYAVNPDGSIKWNYLTSYSEVAFPVIGSDGTIYVSLSDGLLALNSNGTKKWFYEALGNGLACIDKDGTIYFPAYNSDEETSKSSLIAIKGQTSDLYVKTSVDNTNPKVGDIITITFKVGNNGPDTAYYTTMKFVIPAGMKFINAYQDSGTWTYDAATNTIIWDLGNVPKGDPELKVLTEILRTGTYTIQPILSTLTYNPNLVNSIQTIVVNAQENSVNAATVGMQETGIPLPMMVLAILMVLGGLIGAKRK